MDSRNGTQGLEPVSMIAEVSGEFRLEVKSLEAEKQLLHKVGRVQFQLSEHQKALESYSQALTLYRSIGSPIDEARELNVIGVAHMNLSEMQKALESF